MITDYSFLRLKPTFALANELFDPKITTHNYHNLIVLSPNEKYLQISNLSTGIPFDEDYTVELIDICENVLEDVTDRVFISEFINRDGVNQISFEIIPLVTDYYEKEIFFKITHTTGSDIYYSNPFLLTDNKIEQSTRFDYKAYGYFNGIEYDRADFMQSIRLRCYYDRPSDDTGIKDYYQVTRKKTISTRALHLEKEIYKFEYINPFVFRAVNVLLIHDIIYVDGVRMTNKTTVKNDERFGDSNLMEGEFISSKDYDDTYISEYQIFTPLTLTDKIPLGQYSIFSFPTELVGTFNKPVSLNTGTITIYDSLGYVGPYVFTEADITQPTPDSFSIDLNGSDLQTNFVGGFYYVNISNGLFSTAIETFAGISNTSDWVFTIIVGDYLDTDYDSNDYLIH